MGSIMSAIRDDEDDWYQFQLANEITYVKWDVYSPQARHAKELVKKGLKGVNLIEAVSLMISIDALVKKQKDEEDEYKLYQRLHEKYGN